MDKTELLYNGKWGIYNGNGDVMFEHMEELKLLDILDGSSVTRGVYTCRPSHAFIFKLSGTSTYTYEDRVLTLKAGQMLFLPKGDSYRVDKITPGDSHYVLFNFEGPVEGAVARIYDTDALARVGDIRLGLSQAWLLGEAWERYRCMSMFYHILEFVARREQVRYADARHLDRIAPALERLRRDIFEPELRLGQLHRLCGVSDTWFRKVFRDNFGVSVQQYVTNKRLSRAAAVLSGGDWDSVAQVARSVGYTDPLYFSRAFARCYGMSPTAYAKKRL